MMAPGGFFFLPQISPPEARSLATRDVGRRGAP